MWATVLLGAALMTPNLDSTPRQRINFDEGWKFALGNAADPEKDFGFGVEDSFGKAGGGVGALSPGFDDAGWRDVDLPHDWAVELPFVQGNTSALVSHGFKPTGRLFPDTTIGWYRKTFDVPQDAVGRRASVDFDGVFRDSQVWLNGHYMGRHLSGYTGFSFDLTDYLNYGGKNVLVVRVDAGQYEGWFYEGAGIYRHVWLNSLPATHLQDDWLQLVPRLHGDSGSLEVRVGAMNGPSRSKPLVARISVYDPTGKSVGSGSAEFPEGQPSRQVGAQALVQCGKVDLWSIDHPSLYKVVTELVEGGKVVDKLETSVGFRTVVFDKEKGILLNGEPVKIYGACCHQDHAGVGAAVPDALNAWRIKTLKEWGFNALRTSHNPPTPELLDACDRLGMLVLDETRDFGSSQEALDQLRSLIVRDRNHPSVICWSIGNEEWTSTTDVGGRIAATMIRTVKDLDPTRPVSYASNHGNADTGVNALVDWRGFNYMTISDVDKYHKDHPDQLLWGSEEASTLSTRGEYKNDPVKGYMAAYDVNAPGWGATAEKWWTFADARPWYAGAFVWTGFDYRGEPTPYQWPCISSHFGVLDTCGFPKDIAWYYKAWWTKEPVLHILPHWNWSGDEGKPIDVWVFSNHDEVELALNGKSLGRKKMPKDGHLEWQVPYEPGTLVATGFRSGKQVQTSSVETTGTASVLGLTPDRAEIHADGQDVSVVTVFGDDSKGRLDPLAKSLVTFELKGPGRILGVGNGDPSCHEPDQYFSLPHDMPLTDWKWQDSVTADDPAWRAPDFDDSKWPVAHVRGEGRGMRANSLAVYRTTFGLSPSEVGEPWTLGIGQIDDEGWVYVNGSLVLETHDWDRSWSAPVKGHLHAGQNVVVVVVKNNDGQGGLGRGVRLSRPGDPPQWKRSLFHGLAQVIVQAGQSAGSIELTARAPGLKDAHVTIRAK